MDKVLIIDDSGIERRLMHAWLKDDFKIIEANSTEFAVAQIECEKPDCVIIDLNMPNETGFVFIHRLGKAMETTPAIILISGALQESMKRNAMALGASYCIEKESLDKTKLINLIHNVVHRKSA